MCEIRWIDDLTGETTPDDNAPIGRVRCKQYRYVMGRKQAFEGQWSQWFTICADHAKQLTRPDMCEWVFEPAQGDVGFHGEVRGIKQL